MNNVNEMPVELQDVRPEFVRRPFNIEQILREREAQAASKEQMKIDWALLTGKSMDSKDLKRLYADFSIIHGTFMTPNTFERLMSNWSLLTGSLNLTELEQLIRDLGAAHLVTLKKDYLVLNWAKMSPTAFEQFKMNWSLIAEKTGVDNGDYVIKHWLLSYVPYMEYRYMGQEEKVEYTKMCLERGVDVNAVNHGGYSLLHMMTGDGLMLHAPLIELLLSYGADVTLRMPMTNETPLEIFRTNYYNGHEDIVSMLQTAEKPARKNAASYNAELSVRDDITRCDGQQWWIETRESPYLVGLGKLFDNELTDIDNLTINIVNYMYVSRILKTELRFRQRANRFEKIARMHQVFSKICTKLFQVFDGHFDRPVNIAFYPTTQLSESADLVFLLEIDPGLERVALKIYAVPSDIEYFLECKASTKSRFSLGSKLRNHLSICSTNLLCQYKKCFSKRQRLN